MLLHLNDSKQVPRKKREILYDIIREKAVAYGIGVVSEKRIDEINILQATYEAMRMAIANLKVQPDLLLMMRCVSGGRYQAGADHQGRYAVCKYCGGKYRCKGDKRPYDGRI